MGQEDSCELTFGLLASAYRRGIFPMDDGKGNIFWYAPDPRCIIEPKKFHVPRRLKRTIASGRFTLKINSCFAEVIAACAKRETTWLSSPLIKAYTELHKQGLAHSIEVFAQDKLAGGLYGVALGGAFMGESMFHRQTDASKAALYFLVERLYARNFLLLDCQFMTPHLARFGAELISQEDYLKRLALALAQPCHFI